MRKAMLAAGMSLLVGLAGCGAQSASGNYQTNASYDRLFNASRDAVFAIGYTMTSANKADGLIVAQQGVVLGGGSTVGLNAMIVPAGNARILHVTIQAPPAGIALGGLDTSVAAYINAVRARVPDLRAAYP